MRASLLALLCYYLTFYDQIQWAQWGSISAITHPVWIDIGQKLIASFFAHRIYVARSAITPIEIHNRGASVGPVLYGIRMVLCRVVSY